MVVTRVESVFVLIVLFRLVVLLSKEEESGVRSTF